MTIAVLTAVNPDLLREEHRIKIAFLTEGDNAYSINPTIKNRVDALILLDTGGYNCTTAAFYPHLRVPPPVKGQDQWYEAFRLYSLEWYIKKRIPIIGIGTSGLMLWEALGGKIEWFDNQLVPAKDHNKAVFSKSSSWDFSHDVFFGFEDMPMDKDLYALIYKVKSDLDQEALASVPVPASTTPPALSASNHEAIPEEKTAGIDIPSIC